MLSHQFDRFDYEDEVIYPGLQPVRFNNARPTAEKGLLGWVIQAQVGHVNSDMMKTYSHVRRRALDEAAAHCNAPSPQQLRSGEMVN